MHTALQSLQSSLRQMMTWFLSPKSLGLEHDGQHAVKMVANHLSEGYSILESSIRQNRTSEFEVHKFRKADYQSNDKDYLTPVVGLGDWVNHTIPEHVKDFMIHGSLATQDYSRGWSDFDTFLIISRDTCTNGVAITDLRSKLLSAYKFLTSIDPLQHHGFLLCSEVDLFRYHESILPLPVLEKAKSYLGNMTHHFNPIVDIDHNKKHIAMKAKFFKKAGQLGIMQHHAYKGIYLKSHYRNAENGLFQLKYLLGNVAFAPCYYAGAMGQPLYKRDAIDFVKPLLSDASLSFLNSATTVRQEWSKREKFPYRGNRIPDWIASYVDPDYIENLGLFFSELETLVNNPTKQSNTE